MGLLIKRPLCLDRNTTVIEIDNKTKNEVYQSSLIWFAQSFKNSDEVISAKIEGKIISGNFTQQYFYLSAGMWD